jgi:cytochrome P450
MTTPSFSAAPLRLPLPPSPAGATGWRALRALAAGHGPLGALRAVQHDLGPVFQLPIPGFNPVVLSGPEAARFVMLEAREALSFRLDRDPVAHLLRHGLLIEDGAAHDALRAHVEPALHRRQLAGHVEAISRQAAETSATWGDGRVVDVLAAMRSATLLILAERLFGVDLRPDLPRLWGPIQRLLAYISPGLWLVWPNAPRPGFGGARRAVDAYLFGLIAARRAQPRGDGDLITTLVEAGLEDDLIRDQLLTLLIAGHDTSTALLSWALYELGQHPQVQARARAEVRGVLGASTATLESLRGLPYLEAVIKETLRRHPPIHISNRLIVREAEFGGFRLPAGRRLLFSIYLTQHDPAYWPAPDRFDPQRFYLPGAEAARPALSYLPFGAGPRFCVGAAFAQLEARAVLAYVLQHFTLAAGPGRVHGEMGATLMPQPRVRLAITRE